MNRREFFAGPCTLLPSELIARMIAERFEHWRALGYFDESAIRMSEIRGTVSV